MPFLDGKQQASDIKQQVCEITSAIVDEDAMRRLQTASPVCGAPQQDTSGQMLLKKGFRGLI